jgi:IS5 family transposase
MMSQIGRFRTAIGEVGVEELLKASIEVAVPMKAIRASECERVIVDTTAREKAIAHPVDSEVARGQVIEAVKAAGKRSEATSENSARPSQLGSLLARAERIRRQPPKDKDKRYALHAPEVECIGQGKARKRYEFGVKVWALR